VFESIVDFAGIEDFIDEPLRTYSSGMVMRLAFSVAVHMDTDIFIIDEVLAVGDHAFQVKCRAKIQEFKRAGKTLIAVSHAAAGVADVCERAIWLEHGSVVRDGALAEVVAAYEGRPAAP
jgi:ABC-type polysaccharide/polyol phosphate transport system ATPase subunit